MHHHRFVSHHSAKPVAPSSRRFRPSITPSLPLYPGSSPINPLSLREHIEQPRPTTTHESSHRPSTRDGTPSRRHSPV